MKQIPENLALSLQKRMYGWTARIDVYYCVGEDYLIVISRGNEYITEFTMDSHVGLGIISMLFSPIASDMNEASVLPLSSLVKDQFVKSIHIDYFEGTKPEETCTPPKDTTTHDEQTEDEHFEQTEDDCHEPTEREHLEVAQTVDTPSKNTPVDIDALMQLTEDCLISKRGAVKEIYDEERCETEEQEQTVNDNKFSYTWKLKDRYEIGRIMLSKFNIGGQLHLDKIMTIAKCVCDIINRSTDNPISGEDWYNEIIRHIGNVQSYPHAARARINWLLDHAYLDKAKSETNRFNMYIVNDEFFDDFLEIC